MNMTEQYFQMEKLIIGNGLVVKLIAALYFNYNSNLENNTKWKRGLFYLCK
jgi:hypothetical protein